MYAFGTEVARAAILKETHAPFLSHRCSGYPVGPLMTLLQAGCNVWGPQQSSTQASAKPWEENKGWWKTRRREYKEKQQLVTRTHSITLTMHLQPVCVSVCVLLCVVKWGCSFRELQHSTVPTHSTGGPNKNLWSVAQRVISPRCVLYKAPHRKQTLPVL